MLFPFSWAGSYLLIGVQAGITVAAVTKERSPPSSWMQRAHQQDPVRITGLVVCSVVLTYVFVGGIRAAAWANTFQTSVFLVVAAITVYALSDALGGPTEAIQRTASTKPALLVRGEAIEQAHFLSYGLVGLSVGMFPHIFQHWLTARSSSSFKLSVVAHPLLVAAVWLPCVLIGVWAAGVLDLPPHKANAVLGIMVAKFTSLLVSGVLTAGVLAAIMSSLDSQFMRLGTMFTHDVLCGSEDVTEEQKVRWGVPSWWRSRSPTCCCWSARGIFDLGVWCFSILTYPVTALYWRRATAPRHRGRLGDRGDLEHLLRHGHGPAGSSPAGGLMPAPTSSWPRRPRWSASAP